jgi:hypothetical protein
MANEWTAERRERQRQAIQRWQPWQHSTGPRSVEGKASASRNGYRRGARPMLRALARMLKEQQRALRDVSPDAEGGA